MWQLAKRFLPRKWQDAVFAMGEIVFMVSLIPSVLAHRAPAPVTCGATAAFLMTFLAVHISYRLWFTFCLTCVTITLWWILFLQSIS